MMGGEGGGWFCVRKLILRCLIPSGSNPKSINQSINQPINKSPDRIFKEQSIYKVS